MKDVQYFTTEHRTMFLAFGNRYLENWILRITNVIVCHCKIKSAHGRQKKEVGKFSIVIIKDDAAGVFWLHFHCFWATIFAVRLYHCPWSGAHYNTDCSSVLLATFPVDFISAVVCRSATEGCTGIWRDILGVFPGGIPLHYLSYITKNRAGSACCCGRFTSDGEQAYFGLCLWAWLWHYIRHVCLGQCVGWYGELNLLLSLPLLLIWLSWYRLDPAQWDWKAAAKSSLLPQPFRRFPSYCCTHSGALSSSMPSTQTTICILPTLSSVISSCHC